jgi:hypothetical protein
MALVIILQETSKLGIMSLSVSAYYDESKRGTLHTVSTCPTIPSTRTRLSLHIVGKY